MSVQANILKLFILRALQFAYIPMPIIVIFFQDNGIALKEVFILKAIFSVVALILEIPSGYFADVFGRKAAHIWGGVFFLGAYLIYCLAGSFWWFAGAEVSLGIGISLLSGSGEALAYDSLLALGQEHRYRGLEGRMITISSFSEAIGGILGGFLAVSSLRTPFYLEALILACFVGVSLTLVEPPRAKLKQGVSRLVQLKQALAYALFTNKELKWLLIYSAVSGCATYMIAWLAQPYMESVAFPLAFFGLAWAFFHLVMGCVSWYADRIVSLIGERRTLALLPVLIGLGYFCLSACQNIWGVAFILILYLVRGIRLPLTREYINRLTTSESRATVLSLVSFLLRIIFAILSPIVGWMADLYTLSFAFKICAGVFLLLGVSSFLALRRYVPGSSGGHNN
ncbi:MFS transporter [Oligoflexia bacterium]|nr:MFS transporter [Oligoflexia bacterium]